MVLLTTTPRILNAISQLPAEAHAKLPSDLPASTDTPTAHQALVSISRIARQYGLENCTLDSLLRGTKVYRPPPPPKPEPSPEYLALMARLRAEQEAKEYRNLVAKDNGTGTQGDNVAATDLEDEDPITPSVVLNVLLSVIMCGLAMFQMTRWWNNDAWRVLTSMLVAVVVGVAEVVVYASYVRKVKRGKEREKQKLERKVVVGEYNGPGDEIPLQLKDSEMEWERDEIWGKGKHGGMRRRVREKWHKEQENAEGADGK